MQTASFSFSFPRQNHPHQRLTLCRPVDIRTFCKTRFTVNKAIQLPPIRCAPSPNSTAKPLVPLSQWRDTWAALAAVARNFVGALPCLLLELLVKSTRMRTTKTMKTMRAGSKREMRSLTPMTLMGARRWVFRPFHALLPQLTTDVSRPITVSCCRRGNPPIWKARMTMTTKMIATATATASLPAWALASHTRSQVFKVVSTRRTKSSTMNHVSSERGL